MAARATVRFPSLRATKLTAADGAIHRIATKVGRSADLPPRRSRRGIMRRAGARSTRCRD